MNDTKKVLIVGAGIAGCATAITLARLGLDVTVIEKQSEWRFQSSGIFVYSNGLSALREVGVLDGILAAGFAIPDGKNLYFDHLGEPLVDVFYPSADPAVPPILGIKRSEMHRVLAAALDALKVSVRLGCHLASLDTGSAEHPAKVIFSDGSTDSYDLVIGADGIRSQVRQFILPSIQPRKTGFGVWRSVHQRPPALQQKIMQMGIGKRLGIMPIADDKLYIFGTIVEPEDAWYDPADWPTLMREKFAEFDGPVRPFLDDVSADTEVLFTAIEEIAAPLPWHKQRVLLIGDAAHASTPFMGQGGAMAIEDAVVLAAVLKQQNNLFEALETFGAMRLPVCRFVQDASRKVGEAGAVEDAKSCITRNTNMKAGAQGHVDHFYTQLAALQKQAATLLNP